MDLNFQCPHCGQDLTVDDSGAGAEIECPACNNRIIVPAAETKGPHIINPIAASAARREEKHFSVPVHEKPTESLIAKPLVPLEAAAKATGKQLRVKTFRRSDCVEVGKDHFDEVVTKFLSEVGEDNIVSLSPINYTHMELASRQWITDFGVLIVYRG
jgi:DNA-directed RNA polymerase subunit RPC12/RpoP